MRRMCLLSRGRITRWLLTVLTPVAVAIATGALVLTYNQGQAQAAQNVRISANTTQIREQELRNNRQYDLILVELRDMRKDMKEWNLRR